VLVIGLALLFVLRSSSVKAAPRTAESTVQPGLGVSAAPSASAPAPAESAAAPPASASAAPPDPSASAVAPTKTRKPIVKKR
jgi:hypothetical protein